MCAGVFPIAPATFDERGELDLESQKRTVDVLVDAGVNGFCILANSRLRA
jgi:2-keto-3-deoxy-L-arabinonate dehydratase